MQLSHKIELKPTIKQIKYFKKACGTARFVWNWALTEWEKQYELSKQDESILKPTGIGLKKQFNAVKKKEYPWMYEVTKYASQQPFIQLQRSFNNWFRDIKKPKNQKQFQRPKLKKKNKSKDSFYVGGDQVKIIGKKVKIPNLGWVNMKEFLRFEGKINSMTISRSADRWYVSFSVNIKIEPALCESQARVGIDLGINKLATLSNGEEKQGSKPLKRLLRRLKRYQRELSKKTKGSKNRKKIQMKIARLHRKIVNMRHDNLHKLTSYVTDNFKFIAIEDLNVKGMLSNHKLARSISDMGFYEFKRQLMYKAELKKCHVIIANQWFASSKTCCICGKINKELTLADREFSCSCGNLMDRDLNAAKNLEGLFCTESSSGNYACVQDGNVFAYYAPSQPAWVNQEASPMTVRL